MRYRTSIGIEAFFVAMGPTIALLAGWTTGSWLLAGTSACLLGALAWMAAWTRYVIADGVLDVRMGPLHRRIRLDEITSVDRGHRWKGATLGLGSDSVCIEVGEKTVNLSPRDVDGFVQALSMESEGPSRQAIPQA